MNVAKRLYGTLKERLNPMPDKEDEQKVIETIRRGVEFRGVNLWILILAVLIASIGLNVDSTPIIIGAMLISPLMGPIIGTGLAVGINDMELLKRSLHNLLVAALFGVGAATLYFVLSPLDGKAPELLAHTSPTLYDVMIALLGGAAGFLALSSVGNHIQVIVGVAISTALMPPLCSVGLGIATGRWLYALQAFYLVFINSTFIAISTFLFVRLFDFARKDFASEENRRKVKRSIIIISVTALIPSFVFTYGLIHNSRITPSTDEGTAETALQPPPDYRLLDSLIFNEMRILFPDISGLSMGIMWQRDRDNAQSIPCPLARINGDTMDSARAMRITEWLRARTEISGLQVEFTTP